MYDGIGRPFMFGCRTNGAMVWDRVRGEHGLEKKDYAAAERALGESLPGSSLFLWQPENESFPSSPSFDQRRSGNVAPSLAADYGGIIDSTLAAVYWYSRHFSANSSEIDEALYVTGGATDSPQIMRRVAAIWRKPVITIGRVGAALGSAVAGVSALQKAAGVEGGVEALCRSLLPGGTRLQPRPEDVTAYHATDGYLRRFVAEYEREFTRG
jgi:xylulokinase